MNTIRLRFAPSPTGYLHVGGARTALFNWLLAHHDRGKFVLRIEDTDRERSTLAYREAIEEAMRWLGLDWDEGPGVGGPFAPYSQMERLDTYRREAERLIASGRAYHCYCPARQPAPASEDLEPESDTMGECRCGDGSLEPIAGRPYAIRFRTPEDGQTQLTDLIHGEVVFDNREINDFIVMKAEGVATYNFAAVIDDAAMQVSHVLRGDDHLSNTPKQVLLYQALGLPIPQFGHLPMILGSDKKRLSKRHGAVSVQQFRDDGYLPEALVNYLARLGWAHGDQEIFSRQELVNAFSIEGIGSSACVFDYAKLEWLNAEWMKRLGPEEIARRVRPIWEARGWITDRESQQRLTGITASLIERSRTLIQLADQARFYFDLELTWDAPAVAEVLTPAARQTLGALRHRLSDLDNWTHDAIEQVLRGLAADLGLKAGAVIQPARVAVTGKRASPGMFEVLFLLGKRRTLARLDQVL